MATLTLTLNATDIKNAVKDDTYITGQIDKSADIVKNSALAYNEQAGDDEYHNRKIYRSMKAAVSKFEASVVDFVDKGSSTPISDTLDASETGDFHIVIPVTSRFYTAFANTLAALAQDYIIHMMLYSWWQSIKPEFAKNFYTLAQESLVMVKTTLSKIPPSSSSTSYNDVTGEVTADSAAPAASEGSEGSENAQG